MILIAIYAVSLTVARWASLELSERHFRDKQPPDAWVVFWFIPGVNTIMAGMLSIWATAMIMQEMHAFIVEEHRLFRDWRNKKDHSTV